MKCVKCGGKKLEETSVSLGKGIKAKAQKCRECGEMLLEPEAAQKALLLNKLQRGVKVKIGALGKSLVMRFPSELAQYMGLKKGEQVTVYAENDKKAVFTPS